MVRRMWRKGAVWHLRHDRIGEVFYGVVTGATASGVFVRLFNPPTAEGRVVKGEQGLDVGDKVKVRLVDTEPNRGFIDFVRI